MNDNNNTNPPALQRALEMINFFMQDSTPRSLKELSEILNIPHSSVFRIVHCLVEYGYLHTAYNEPNKYVLGYKLTQLSKSSLNDQVVAKTFLPYMKEVSNSTNQVCQLCVLTKGYVTTIEQVFPSNATIAYIAKIGEKLPVNISACGKLLVSYLPKKQRTALLKKIKSSFIQNTENTITDLKEFELALDEINAKGYAVDIEEFALGIGCLAIPIFDYSNLPIAGLVVTGSVNNYTDPEIFHSIYTKVQKVGKSISKELGYSLSE